MRTVFFGTPEFSVPTLAAMTEGGFAPDLVVAQPARPVGRGRKLLDPPIASWARERGLSVAQPESVRQPEFMAQLRELEPDVAIVVAFGQIFRKALLGLPRHGCINLHASLLPLYRGAAPIQAAIAAGDRVTGVSTMQMGRGLDNGPVLLQREVEIGREETSAELSPRLAALGAELTLETLQALGRGELVPQPQDDRAASYAPRLQKSDGLVDWSLGAQAIHDRRRGFTPWPGLSSELRSKALKILETRVAIQSQADETRRPGALLGLEQGWIRVLCGDGTILLLGRVQRPGKSPVSAQDFWNGERLSTEDHLGTEA